jgi:hypothetical protein
MPGNRWLAVVLESGERHVLPIDDLRPHFRLPGCWCGPTDDSDIWVHHSLDRREDYETGRKLS